MENTGPRMRVKLHENEPKKIKMEIYNSWVNVNREGSINTPHNHGTADLSGALYVKVEDDLATPQFHLIFLNAFGLTDGPAPGGSIFFVDPRDGASHTIGLKPSVGTLVLMPPWLKHWVSPVVTKELRQVDRISLAINVRFEVEDIEEGEGTVVLRRDLDSYVATSTADY